MAARIFSLHDYPHPDEDSVGNLILWVEDDAVVVLPHENGWVEVADVAAVL